MMNSQAGGGAGRHSYVRQVEYLHCATRLPGVREKNIVEPDDDAGEDEWEDYRLTHERVLLTRLDFFFMMKKLLSFINSEWPADGAYRISLKVNCDIDKFWFGHDDEPCVRGPRDEWVLPVALAITAFSLHTDHLYQLHHGGWMPKIQAAMPSLTELGWHFNREDDVPEVRVSHTVQSLDSTPQEHEKYAVPHLSEVRKVPYTALTTCLDMSKLQSLSLDLRLCHAWATRVRVTRNRISRVTDIAHPINVAFNRVLRTLSTQLRRLSIDGHWIITPDIFWPTNTDQHDESNHARASIGGEDSPSSPQWPHLTHISIRGRLKSYPHVEDFFPKGIWDSPDWGKAVACSSSTRSSEYDLALLNRPKPPSPMHANHIAALAKARSKFDELVVAASRAILKMPRLERFLLAFDHEILLSDDQGVGECCVADASLNNDNSCPLPYLMYQRWRVGSRVEDGGVYDPFKEMASLTGWDVPFEAMENWEELVKGFRGEKRGV